MWVYTKQKDIKWYQMGLILDVPKFKFYVLSTKNTAPLKMILIAEDSSLLTVCYSSKGRIY